MHKMILKVDHNDDCPLTVMLKTKVGKKGESPNALWVEAITTKGGGKISR